MFGRGLFIAALICGATSSGAAGFSCDKAQHPVEQMICADAELSELDEHLARYFTGAKTELRASGDCLVADQRQWLRSVRNACTDKVCLKTVYLDRLGELDALQPGANAIKGFDLPRYPALVWVVPPASDRVAAPLRPKAKPLAAKGTLVDEVAAGDGFVLRTRQGEHLLVPLMFVDGDTASRLSMLAKSSRTTYLARGAAAVDETGRTNFEPSQCVFVYRVR